MYCKRYKIKKSSNYITKRKGVSPLYAETPYVIKYEKGLFIWA